ncbi:hypothetical protein FHX15_005264 [Rhizobium sp. BK650]|uniref:DUF982 domain-containing protein n=1 Tax=Rhizobium sp. BK650 TaxID=2586990 RepID=UPI0016125E20|nr:DUF982 domain-containing protein [Rhizobium sp. BK650]MBB3659995.1 hypothetical protein [Rhizobium sp. BK650]
MDDIASMPIREIAVFLPGSDRPRIASTVEDIMGILMANEWWKKPNDTGWQHALATCFRALQGEQDASKARVAFVNVARDAGFKVLPDDERKSRSRATAAKTQKSGEWRSHVR